MLTELGNDLKKVALAGVGAAAIAGEKADEIAGELVKKGEQVVQKGKMVNEELKRRKSASCVEGELERWASQLTAEERHRLIDILAAMDEDHQGEV